MLYACSIKSSITWQKRKEMRPVGRNRMREWERNWNIYQQLGRPRRLRESFLHFLSGTAMERSFSLFFTLKRDFGPTGRIQGLREKEKRKKWRQLFTRDDVIRTLRRGLQAVTWRELRGSSIKTWEKNDLNQLQLKLLTLAQVVNIWWLFFFDQFT